MSLSPQKPSSHLVGPLPRPFSLDNFSDLPYFDNFDSFEVFFFLIYWVCSCFTMLCKLLQYTDKVSHTL